MSLKFVVMIIIESCFGSFQNGTSNQASTSTPKYLISPSQQQEVKVNPPPIIPIPNEIEQNLNINNLVTTLNDNVSLSLLNSFRKKHGVPPLQYSEELAKKAAAWGRRVHDKVISFGKLVPLYSHPHTEGENVFVSSGGLEASVDGTTALQKWYSEGNAYDYGRREWSVKTAGFTQLVWKSTRDVGLAVIYDGKRNFTVVVARFKPPGNVGFNSSFWENVGVVKNVSNFENAKDEGSNSSAQQSQMKIPNRNASTWNGQLLNSEQERHANSSRNSSAVIPSKGRMLTKSEISNIQVKSKSKKIQEGTSTARPVPLTPEVGPFDVPTTATPMKNSSIGEPINANANDMKVLAKTISPVIPNTTKRPVAKPHHRESGKSSVSSTSTEKAKVASATESTAPKPVDAKAVNEAIMKPQSEKRVKNGPLSVHANMQAEVRNATNRENRNDKKVKPTTESTTEISILSRKSTGSTTIPTTTKRSVWKRNEEGKGNLEAKGQEGEGGGLWDWIREYFNFNLNDEKSAPEEHRNKGQGSPNQSVQERGSSRGSSISMED